MDARIKNFDWESIEREYRAGQLSLTEIGKTHNISRKWIMKHAVEKGWLTKAKPYRLTAKGMSSAAAFLRR